MATVDKEPSEREYFVNVGEALARVRDNKNLYRKMLDMFLESGDFASLEESLLQKNYGKAADIAHAIKGMTGNLSLTRLYQVSSRLTEELRQELAADETLADFWAAYSKTRVYVEAIVKEMAAE